jgi:hypothetical protein
VVERCLELTAELQRVEGLIERVELGVLGGRQDPGRAHTLIGRLGTIKDAVQARAGAVLGHELFNGLEEVDVKAGHGVDASELRIRRVCREAKRSYPTRWRTTAPFFCSTYALSFFFQARLRVNVRPSRVPSPPRPCGVESIYLLDPGTVLIHCGAVSRPK